VRRTVATLLVVASPLLMVAPVGAAETRPAVGRAAPPAVDVVAAPVAAPTPAVTPAGAPVAPAAPAVAPPIAAAGTVAAPVPRPPAAGVATAASQPPAAAVTAPAVHSPARAVRGKGRPAAGLDDTVYSARLQADLCQARQIFCGLDHGGHYRVG
jgi:hypothetical protein